MDESTQKIASAEERARDRELLDRVRTRWWETLTRIAREKGRCDAVERRMLSRWYAALVILRERVEREEPQSWCPERSGPQRG